MKILFIGPTRIGDTILSTSIINYYLEKYDDCNFTIITSPFANNLYMKMPRLVQILVVNKKKFGMHWIDIIKFSIFKKWDLIIDLRSSVASYFLLAKKRKVFKGNNEFHKVIQFQKFLNTDKKLTPKIWYNSDDYLNLKEISKFKPLIAIAPYSNWFKKDWSITNYKTLLQNKLFKDYTIILAGLKKDIRNKKEFDELLDSPDLNVINLFDLSLIEMAPIFDQCDFFIGSDSGLMHLSSSTNCKTFALFGPTNDLVYGPWGNHEVIKSDENMDYGLEKLSVEKVLNSIKEYIK
tara:strand:- start:374 stop:1252 length:879 start_codon:yes stop_codon:yes gene_type:complete